jgi:hypothetical protein
LIRSTCDIPPKIIFKQMYCASVFSYLIASASRKRIRSQCSIHCLHKKEILQNILRSWHILSVQQGKILQFLWTKHVKRNFLLLKLQTTKRLMTETWWLLVKTIEVNYFIAWLDVSMATTFLNGVLRNLV